MCLAGNLSGSGGFGGPCVFSLYSNPKYRVIKNN